MNTVIPAILAKDEQEFKQKLGLLDGFTGIVQIDVMDGLFVPNTTWCDFAVLRQLAEGRAQGSAPTPMFELHLMVQDPEAFMNEALGIPSIKRIIWHVESAANHHQLLLRCHEYEKENGLAISPHTAIEELTTHITELDEILILGAEPGFSGQAIDQRMYERVRQLHAKWPTIPLGFDVGVSTTTIPALRDAGVTRFCAASAVFGHPDTKQALQALQEI